MMKWYGIPNGKNYDDVYGFDINETNEKLIDAFQSKN